MGGKINSFHSNFHLSVNRILLARSSATSYSPFVFSVVKLIIIALKLKVYMCVHVCVCLSVILLTHLKVSKSLLREVAFN